jgi:hypothetical protein
MTQDVEDLKGLIEDIEKSELSIHQSINTFRWGILGDDANSIKVDLKAGLKALAVAKKAILFTAFELDMLDWDTKKLK